MDSGAALTAFKFWWNGVEQYQNVLIDLADFHFMKENFQVLHAYENNSSPASSILLYPKYPTLSVGYSEASYCTEY